MFILRSIVGKLWLTIIGLVAVVIILLGSFLIPNVDNYFSQYKDQTKSLMKLAEHAAKEVTFRSSEPFFEQVLGELIGFHDAQLILVHRDQSEEVIPHDGEEPILYRAKDFFSNEEIAAVFSGASVDTSQLANSKGSVSPHDQYMAVAVPVWSADRAQIESAAIIYQPLNSYRTTSSYVIRLFVYVGLIGFTMTTVFAFFLFYKITQPMQRLKNAAGLISMGELGIRVPIISNDEIGELAKTFNKMAEELQETIQAHSNEKEHLASVLRSMTDAVITFDAEGQIILTNPQGNKILREWSSINSWSDAVQESGNPGRLGELPDPLEPLFSQVIANGTEIATKLHVRSAVWSIVMTPLYAQDGVRGAVAVLRNVTEEFRLDKLRKDFVANVSHELRTPLSMLQGYSEALIDDIAGTVEERKELAQVIYDESLRMSRLVHDLLDLARLEAGQMQMNYSQVNVNNLIRRIYRKFSVSAKDQDITLVFEVSEQELLLQHADEDKLEQVLTNLLDNALRHTNAGKKIYLRAHPKRQDGEDGVMLEVEDEGVGIPAEDLPYIFERFYKADKARKRVSTSGTGLGLAIVKNIIDAHQGTVDVKSTIGHGTTFTIFLQNNKG